MWPQRPPMISGPGEVKGQAALASAAVALAAVLWFLAQQLSLQREDVVQDPIDPPAFETVVGDDAGPFEVAPEQCPQWSVNPRATSHLGFLEELQAAVEGKLAEPVLANRHLGAQHLHPRGGGDANLDLVERRQRVRRAAGFAVGSERHRVAGTLEEA